jgi:hypothetical protein
LFSQTEKETGIKSKSFIKKEFSILLIFSLNGNNQLGEANTSSTSPFTLSHSKITTQAYACLDVQDNKSFLRDSDILN